MDWFFRNRVLVLTEPLREAHASERHGDSVDEGVWVTWLSVAATAVPAQAQGSADPNPVFRAIFQDDSGVVAVPFTSAPTMFGSWHIHGGVESLMLGDRNEAVFGDSSYVIGSIGTGLSY